MNKPLRITIIVLAALVGAAILVTGGIFIGQKITGRNVAANGWFPFNSMHRFNDREPYGMYGMMGNSFSGRFNSQNQPEQYYGMGPGMTGRGYSYRYDDRDLPGTPYSMGPGMMGRGFSYRFDGQNLPGAPYGMSPGMMGDFGSGFYTGDPLTVEQAKDAFDAYLADLGNSDLTVAEVMVFDQNAYALVKEESTGMGAMELLVDHASGSVFPEYGPNMMWNLKYGMMGGGRGHFGMGTFFSGINSNNSNFKFEAMPVTLEEAQTAAQSYLDNAVPGATLDGEGMTFYGYYTFDYQVDGQIAGMLSVNGYSGDIWPHTWHGSFITEQEFE